jgi:hypothetical protein
MKFKTLKPSNSPIQKLSNTQTLQLKNPLTLKTRLHLHTSDMNRAVSGISAFVV